MWLLASGMEFSLYSECIEWLAFHSQGLADNTVVAKVNGEVWDLDRPLEADAELKLLKFDDPEGEFSISIIAIFY